MSSENRQAKIRNYQYAATVCGALAVVSGFIVLLGWALGKPEFTVLLPNTVTMKPNTALAFMLTGLSVIVISIQKQGNRLTRFGQILGLSVAIIGGLTLVEMITGLDLGIDELLFRDLPNPVATSVPGRMAPPTALSFLLLGVALAVIERKSHERLHNSELLVIMPLLLGLISLAEYALNAPILYSFSYYTHMAVLTAAVMVFLSIGIICLRPDRGFIGYLAGGKFDKGELRVYLTLSIAILVVLTVGGWFYRAQENSLQKEIESNLASIARLKVDSIVQWRSERLGDAGVIMDNTLFTEGVASWLNKPAAENKKKILDNFQALKKYYSYHEVMFVDMRGNVLLDISDARIALTAATRQAINKAMKERQPVIGELHFEQGEEIPHIDIVAPIFAGKAPDAPPLGAIVMQQEASFFLYPMITAWPTESHTAETILCRREANAVLYLNELRHRKGTALKYSFPLTKTDLSAVKGALGQTGIVYSSDYRGVKVLAALYDIPGSPWFIVSKIDEEEAFQEWRARAGMILFIIGILASALIVSARMILALRAGNQELAISENTVRELNHTLEDKVEKRTNELKKAVASLERTNRELEQFAYVASHDLQEPLRMVSSFTQLLAEQYKGRLDADADEYIHYAVDGANRMQKLIQDLLSYSRLTTRSTPFEPVDLNSVMVAVRRNLQIQIEESGAAILHDTLPTVFADASQITQLLQNLISNAIKFRGAEPPQICITANRDGELWKISVSDNGIGIEAQYYERIFLMFQRLHNREDYQGTGIGLAVCKKIVERHGGTIGVESVYGEGTTFWFTLPANV